MDKIRAIGNDPLGRFADNDFFLNLAEGSIPGCSTEFKFGRSTAISAVESVIWDNGGNYIFLEAAETMTVVSNDAADNVAGAGAILVGIFGLDADFLPVNEIITMTGVTPIITEQSFIRVFRAIVITSGTNDPITDANIGTITVTGSTSTNLQAKILPNNGQTLMAVYTIPAGKTGYATGVAFSAGEGKQCLFKAKFRNAAPPAGAFSIKFLMDLYQSQFFGTLVTPLRVPEKTDIVITGQSGVPAIDASASFGIILKDNEV